MSQSTEARRCDEYTSCSLRRWARWSAAMHKPPPGQFDPPSSTFLTGSKPDMKSEASQDTQTPRATPSDSTPTQRSPSMQTPDSSQGVKSYGTHRQSVELFVHVVRSELKFTPVQSAVIESAGGSSPQTRPSLQPSDAEHSSPVSPAFTAACPKFNLTPFAPLASITRAKINEAAKGRKKLEKWFDMNMSCCVLATDDFNSF